MKLSAYWNKLVKFLGFDADENTSALASSDNTDTSYHKTRPGWLKLQFSKAADASHLSRLFDPEIKGDIDPDDNVFKRKSEYFDSAIEKGHAVFLADENGDVHSMNFAYRTSLDGSDKSPSDFVETGTALTTIAGYQTAMLLGSAAVLKTWWEDEDPAISYAAAIKENNIASVKTFLKMGWVKNESVELDEQINASCNQNVDPSYAHDSDEPSDEDWYVLGPDAIQTKARILTEFIERGTLHNKHTGEDIQLDMSALDDIGLTLGRLKAIAYAGITDKAHLKSMADYRQDQQPRQLMP